MYELDENTRKRLEYEKRIAVAVVHSTATGLAAVLSNYRDEDERVNFIRTYAAPIRFYQDESGYFFVFSYDGLNIVNANPKSLEGQNMFDVRDSQGNFVVRKMSSVASRGGGFVEYYWARPGSESGEQLRKLGYVEPIPGTDYFIGTGVYMED